jgi:hypothetical protein
MNNIVQRPPPGEPFVWQTHALRTSDAWRSAGINARRFVDFLLIEHMNHGGRANGLLKAPHRQLEVFGIPSRRVADAIREAEELGLVDCHRGNRIATTYAITWLSSHDGAPATNRWQTYLNPNYPSSPRNLYERPIIANLPDKVRADGANLPKSTRQSEGRWGKSTRQSEGRWGKSARQSEGRMAQKSTRQSEGAYKNNSYHRQESQVRTYQVGVRTYHEAGKEESLSCNWHVTNGSGLTTCGKPVVPGKDRCAEHGAGGANH